MTCSDSARALSLPADLTDREERLETLHHLIGRLPELNHAVFERLIFHLARWVLTHMCVAGSTACTSLVPWPPPQGGPGYVAMYVHMYIYKLSW